MYTLLIGVGWLVCQYNMIQYRYHNFIPDDATKVVVGQTVVGLTTAEILRAVHHMK